MAGRLASQATGAFDVAMNGGPEISMCGLRSVPVANPHIGTGQEGKRRIIVRSKTDREIFQHLGFFN